MAPSGPTAGLVLLAREKLTTMGVPVEQLEVIDALVARDACRRSLSGLRCRVFGGELPARSLIGIGDGVYVADIRLCALQAASDLSFRELVEYLFEICGGYSLPLERGGDYLDREPLTTVDELGAFFEAASRYPGSEKARRALRYVRGRSRSPMETALVMMLTLPRRDGGLGIRDLEMDYKIEVGERTRRLTRRRCFYCDAYVHRALLDIEYHGFFHDDEDRAVIDDERVNALRAMGCTVTSIRRGAFFDARGFRRFSASICKTLCISPSKLPEGFEAKQEELRRFVLRRWL